MNWVPAGDALIRKEQAHQAEHQMQTAGWDGGGSGTSRILTMMIARVPDRRSILVGGVQQRGGRHERHCPNVFQLEPKGETP